MGGPAIDLYYHKELEYQKILQNVSGKLGEEYTNKMEHRNTGWAVKDFRENFVNDIRAKSKSSVPKVASILAGEGSFFGHADEVTGFSSCRHAPVFHPRLDQRSYFASEIQFGKYTPPTKKFKKVTHCVFDLDGTIIDSERQYHIIVKEICAKYGKDYTKELEFKNFGVTNKQVCENVVKDLQLNMSPTELENELNDSTKTRLPNAPLKKGMERLLKHLFRSGVLFALATNSTRREVHLHVATKPKIFRMFHHMVCAGDPDVDRGKPFPDLYLIAASKFPDKPSPVKCLVFEDSLIGLEAGVAAGMQVIMIPPQSLPLLKCAAATLVLESVLDFNPEDFGLPPFTDDLKNKRKPKPS